MQADADVRVNGGFRFRMTGPQGEMAVEAIYEVGWFICGASSQWSRVAHHVSL
jgi:hypothetical protein